MKNLFRSITETKAGSNLYVQLSCLDLSPSFIEDLGDEMALVKDQVCGWWKPRFVMDHRNKTAFMFLDDDMCLAFATTDDIDWASLEGIEDSSYMRARNLDANFPTWVSPFHNGIAEVRWQLNPDGRYYEEEDRFGMTSDVELEIYGYIDRTGKVLVKFKHVHEDWDELSQMRDEAKKLAR